MLLFAVTALWGRLWCGFACPQTVYTALFMWVERQCEGDRYQRIRLEQAPWGAAKVWRRGGKQMLWLAIVLWTGLTFVGWFTPVRTLAQDVALGSLGFWAGFWALFYGGFCYLNDGLLREKVCQHMCPYGRFQGALMDVDTRIVAYDTRRGEPRGTPAAAQRGGCIDCTVCVQVCPTGIDIRDGLQPARIAYGLSVDACDSIMDKLGQPRGLVRMATQRYLAADDGTLGTASAWSRQRVRVYAAIKSMLLLALGWALCERPSLRVDVIRDRGVMARLVDDGAVENLYRLQLMNQTDEAQAITVGIGGLPSAVVRAPTVTLSPAADRQVQLSVRLPAEQVAQWAGHTLPLRFEVASRSAQDSALVTETSTFVVPR